jgi:hypothetical protein
MIRKFQSRDKQQIANRVRHNEHQDSVNKKILERQVKSDENCVFAAAVY